MNVVVGINGKHSKRKSPGGVGCKVERSPPRKMTMISTISYHTSHPPLCIKLSSQSPVIHRATLPGMERNKQYRSLHLLGWMNLEVLENAYISPCRNFTLKLTFISYSMLEVIARFTGY